MLFTSLRCTDMNVALKIYTCRSLKHCFDYLHTDLWIDHKPTHPQWVYLFCPFQSIYMFSVHPTEKDLQTLSVSALLSFLEDHPVTKICELRVFPVSHNLVVDSPCERRSFWECLYCWWEEVWELSPLLPPPVLSLNHGAALYKLQHHLLEAGGRCVPGKLKMVVSLAVQQPSRPRLW